MSKTKTTTLNFGEVLKRAKDGIYKLPAFQRKWKWTNKQVMSLFDSLRLGYPIGAFLFLTSEDGTRLGPRSFYGTGKKASSNLKFESLILDGQQRITAGLSLYYGLEEVEGSEYYIDVKKIEFLLKEKKININDDVEVEMFCTNLEIDDGYLIAKKRRTDRDYYFTQNALLWTVFLTEEKQNDLEELLEKNINKELNIIIKKVIRRYLKPNVNIQIPVIELGSDFDLAAVSKVFSTINSTGKLLTPFELVVAILYPHDITLEDDVSEYKSKYPYYDNMDKHGEILLQTIALLAKKSPKKSDLPKNIDESTYRTHAKDAVSQLNDLGEFLSGSMGIGLDITDKLIPYDAIFAPMALCYNYIKKTIRKQNDLATAKFKLKRWFVASAITQRYQEGVHNKQSNDLKDINDWISNDANIPNWIRDTHITVAIKDASPSGAIGKLILCLLNHNNPKDPLSDEGIGFKDKVLTSQVHHIFPTKWVSKGISDYKNKLETNLALNTMLLSSNTNADWLNFDPKTQIDQSMKALNSKTTMEKVFALQLIDTEAISILQKESKRMNDYDDFIQRRYKALVKKLEEYDISEAEEKGEYSPELESPSIVNEP